MLLHNGVSAVLEPLQRAELHVACLPFMPDPVQVFQAILAEGSALLVPS